MKKVLKVFFIVIGIIILFIAGFAIYLNSGLKSGAKLQINNISLSSMKDGTYNGEYKGGRWSNKVEVVVKNKKIADIKYIKDVAFPANDVMKKIIDEVEQKQSLDVDTISGATVTTKAYLKSIENALSSK